MNFNKKFILPLLLILITCLSISAITAADVDSDVLSQSDDVSISEASQPEITASNILKEDSQQNTYSINNSQSIDQIQNAFDGASDGDIINFTDSEYTFDEQKPITVSHNLTVNGNGAIINVKTGTSKTLNVFEIDGGAAGSTFTGFNFIFTNDEGTNNNGRAISISGSSYVSIIDSTFTNGSSGIYSSGSNNILIDNCNFTGVAVTVNKNGKEAGTKAVDLMGTSNSTVKNSYFYEDVLDGVSAASNSKNLLIANNTFYKNEYGIFFGGGVTDAKVLNNVFINCTAQSISSAKSQTDRVISGNTFYLLVGNYTSRSGINSTGVRPGIYINIGNTAHGSPSSLANFTIDGNNFIAQYVNGTTDEKAVAIQVENQNGTLKTTNNSTNFTIVNNVVDKNTKLLNFVNLATGETFDNIIVINNRETKVQSQIISSNFTQTAVDFNNGERGGFFEVTLKDINGNALANKPIVIGFNGVVYNKTTDANGVAGLQINLRSAGDYTFAISYLGDDQYIGDFVVNTIKITKKPSRLTLTGNSAVKVNAVKTLTVKLTGKNALNSSYRNAVGKKVTLSVNGKTYTATTNNKGVATFKVKISKAGTYTITTKFAGDYTYSAKTTTSRITVRR